MRRKKKLEFSKIILCVVSAFAVAVTIFTCVAVIVTGDTSALAYLIPSIFAELATATVTTTQTLTLHADSKAKLTDAEKAIATEKGWTIA